MDEHKLAYLYMIEEVVTKAMKGCKRAIIELYTLEPELFRRGTKTNTLLDPFLHKANYMER